jgi:hypothetical protein
MIQRAKARDVVASMNRIVVTLESVLPPGTGEPILDVQAGEDFKSRSAIRRGEAAFR